MPRIRYLKPDFFKDEHIKDLPYEARLFYQGLWCYADKQGRLEDRPERLKVEIMPYDKIDIEKILTLLAAPKKNSKRPYILRYSINKENYIQILQWNKHQKPHHTEQESIIPEPSKDILEPLNNGCLPVVAQEGMGMEKGMEKIKSKGEDKEERIVKFDLEAPILYLNEKAKTTFDPKNKANIAFIQARFNEGRTIDDFKKVIDKKVKAWLTDEKMMMYLRPETLFNRSKFESYLNEPEVTEQNAFKKKWVTKKE